MVEAQEIDTTTNSILTPSSHLPLLNNIKIEQDDASNSVLILYSNQQIDYEIITNFKQQVFTIKLRNINLDKESFSLIEYNNTIRSIQYEKVSETEYWILVKLSKPNINYIIDPTVLEDGQLKIILSSEHRDDSVSDAKKVNTITNWRSGTKERTELITINFTHKPKVQLKKIDFPQSLYRIKFFDTAVPTLKNIKTESTLFKKINFKKVQANLFFDIIPHREMLRITLTEFEDPFRVILRIEKEHRNRDILEKEKSRLDKMLDKKISKNVKKVLNQRFIVAEKIFRSGNWKLAKLAFNNLYAVAPFSRIGIRAGFRAADAEYQAAIESEEAEKYLSAIEKYNAAIGFAEEAGILGSDIIKAKYNIAVAYLEAGFNDLAKIAFEEIINLNSNHPLTQDAAYRIGTTYIAQKNSTRGIQHLKKTIKKYPDSRLKAKGYFDIGKGYYELAQFEKAADNFDIAKSLNQHISRDIPQDLFKMAESYYEANQVEKANAINQDILSRFPFLPITSFISIRIGDYFRNQNKPELAISYYEFAINRRPINIALLARLRIANILAESQKEENKNIAIDFYDYIINDHPNSELVEEALLRKGLTYSFFQEYAKSIAILQEFLKKYPDTEFTKTVDVEQRILDNVLELIRDSYSNEKFYQVVNLYFQYATELESTPTKFPYLLIASAFKSIGDVESSNKIYQSAIQLSVLNISNVSSFELAYNYYQHNQLDQSLQSFQDYVKNYPDDLYQIFARLFIAQIYTKQNETFLAIKEYKEIIKQHKNSSKTINFSVVTQAEFQLAQIYEDEGAFQDAFQLYQDIINNYRYPLNSPNILSFVKEAFFKLGDMHIELNQPKKAIKAYNNAINLFQDSDNVLKAKYQIGSIYQSMDKDDKALEIYNEVLNTPRQPNDILIWYQLAQEGVNEINTKNIAPQ